MVYALVMIIDLAFAVSLIILAYYWFKRRKNKVAYQKKFYFSIISSVALLVLLGFSTQLIPTDNSKDETSSKPSEQQVQKNSTKNKENSSKTTDDNDSYTSTQVNKINHQLVLNLKDDQKDADKGDQNYDWSNYVLKIKIQKNKTAYVYVDGSFMNLSEEARKLVGKRTNGLIGTSIATAGIDYALEEGREGIYMSFYNGPQAIGHSKYTDHTSFKWYE